MPHSLATSVKRNGLDSVCLVRTIDGATTVMRSPAMFDTILAWELLSDDCPGVGDFPRAPEWTGAVADLSPGGLAEPTGWRCHIPPQPPRSPEYPEHHGPLTDCPERHCIRPMRKTSATRPRPGAKRIDKFWKNRSPTRPGREPLEIVVHDESERGIVSRTLDGCRPSPEPRSRPLPRLEVPGSPVARETGQPGCPILCDTACQIRILSIRFPCPFE